MLSFCSSRINLWPTKLNFTRCWITNQSINHESSENQSATKTLHKIFGPSWSEKSTFPFFKMLIFFCSDEIFKAMKKVFWFSMFFGEKVNKLKIATDLEKAGSESVGGHHNGCCQAIPEYPTVGLAGIPVLTFIRVILKDFQLIKYMAVNDKHKFCNPCKQCKVVCIIEFF